MKNRALHFASGSWWVLAFAGLLLGALPLTASGPDPVAEVRIGTTTVDFEFKVPLEHLVFVVGGPGDFYHREELSGDSAPVFDLAQAAGDGLYTYELRALPQLEPAVREALTAALKQGDDDAIQELREAGKIPEPLIQSGSFSIREGAFVVGRQREIVEKVEHPGDVNIVGWLCIGDDECHSNSTYNNALHLWDEDLRIHFEDSSSTSNYPSNDWRILINDLSDGGANYFAVEDSSASKTPFTVEAGARTNALYVEDDDDVGIGTANPAKDLHLVTGNEPTVRFEQDTSGGDTAQIWDLAANEDEFSLTDVTNSSAVPLLIEAGAPTDTIYVDSAGYVGLGTNSPLDMIHLKSADSPGIRIENPDALPDGDDWQIRVVDVGSLRLSEVGTGIVEFEITNTGTVYMVDKVFELQPDGDLIIDGSLTTAGGTYPDYVFEDDYPLLPLPDLATFVAEHKHLPNVPTAEEVDGGARINMTELQLSLLEKVEELTLYTLSQYRTIQSQQGVIRELQERLLALEQRLQRAE